MTDGPMFPPSLMMTGEDQTLRRKRIQQGKHRTWEVLPRYGTADSDRWTVVGRPIPAEDNPARLIEDGQFATLEDAYAAAGECDLIDDGTHEEND